MKYLVVVPLAPTSFTPQFRGKDQIEISWTAPTTGSYKDFKVSYGRSASDLIKTMETVESTSYQASNLQPASSYVFSVYSSSGDELSGALEGQASTSKS